MYSVLPTCYIEFHIFSNTYIAVYAITTFHDQIVKNAELRFIELIKLLYQVSIKKDQSNLVEKQQFIKAYPLFGG